MTETLQEKIARVTREEVKIVPYDPRWPELFLQEKEHLLRCLPNELIGSVEHYGSTAVPGLPAKPIVDMLVELTDMESARRRIPPILEAQGYDYFWRPTFGDDVPPFYPWFIKRDPLTGIRTHHVHMVTTGPEFAPHWEALLFRDYLIAHPDVAREYAELKMRLAAEYPNDREAYTAAKGGFVARVTEQAKHERGR
jgi:GrpB-like predicted nucleotidyltransferase (UPF0157 family)